MNPLLDRLKVPTLIILISLALFFLFVKIFGPIPFTINSIVTNKADLFTVDGSGEASGVPSTAEFMVGVTKTGASVTVVQEQVNTTTNKIVAELKKLGIGKNEIKTSDYSVNPNIDYNSGRQTTTGYTVSTTISVTLSDSALANKALDSATANGATTINGVSFVLSDEDKIKLEDEARMEAIKEAKERAQKISHQAGIRLGKIVNVYVSSPERPMMFDKMSVSNAGGGAPEPETQLQPGENKVSVSVSLSYETL
jgi:hypothetical protein